MAAPTREALDFRRDRQFLAAPTLSQQHPKDPLAMSVSVGTIYFTLDGTDPRLPGGKVSDKATAYASPVKPSRGGRLFARVFHEGRWSQPLKR